jgi:hypothetical protein
MSRDYKPSPERNKTARKGNPFFNGLMVGVLLGVGASLAVVMYIKGGDSPFSELSNNKKSLAAQIAEDAKKAAETAQSHQNTDDNREDTTKFDFYTILPGSESKISTDDVGQKNQQPEPLVQPSYYLQAGAFQTEAEADNMKAKLALLGFEALVQTATIPDKGILHRVRVGPLSNLDEINKTKNDLAANGFKTDLIKVTNENQ